MRSMAVALGFVVAMGAFAAASAQEPRLTGKLSDATRARIDSLLAVARAETLPKEPIVDRALEGVAKRAPETLIIAAVNRLLGELRVARQAFGESASDAELTAGASAVRAGATRAHLVRLRQLRPQQPLTIPTAVLADLVSAGVPADTGIAAVLALASNAADADYIAFRRNVERDIALGASPASAVGARLRGVGDHAVSAPPPTLGETNSGSGGGIRKRKP